MFSLIKLQFKFKFLKCILKFLLNFKAVISKVGAIAFLEMLEGVLNDKRAAAELHFTIEVFEIQIFLS